MPADDTTGTPIDHTKGRAYQVAQMAAEIKAKSNGADTETDPAVNSGYREQPAEAPDYGEVKPFKFLSMDDLAETEQRMDWLVKGVIECETHGMLFGDPESGKTLVLFDLLYCIASGRPWHGHKVKQGAVFYICGEGRGGLGRRAAAWRKENNIQPGARFPFYTSEIPAQLLDANSAHAVSEAIKAMCEATGATPVAIGIDTLARNFGGGNENAAQDMGTVIQNIDHHLIHELKAAILTSHHTGHGDKERARGSMSMLGALDVCYKVSKDEQSVVRMESTKCKDFDRPEPFAFKLAVHDLGYKDEDGDPITGATVRAIEYTPMQSKAMLKGTAAKVMQVLVAEYGATAARNKAKGHDIPTLISVDYWRDKAIDDLLGGQSRLEVEDNTIRSKRVMVNKQINALINEGHVKRRADNIHVYPCE